MKTMNQVSKINFQTMRNLDSFSIHLPYCDVLPCGLCDVEDTKLVGGVAHCWRIFLVYREKAKPLWNPYSFRRQAKYL